MRSVRRLANGRRLGGCLALGLALLGVPSAAGAAAQQAVTPAWVTTSGTVVHLNIIAGWNNANAGFNFNGGAHGQLVVTVPLGDKVMATYQNKQGFHDVVIIPYQATVPGESLPPAFAGAASPRPQFGPGGPPATGKPQTFSFVASKAGKYMMICGVPGHALAGMWDTFVVSSTAKVASVTMSTM